MNGAIVSVYAIFANAEEAGRIGRAMVDQRLAACVNILGPCRSIYRWQDAIEEAEEAPAIFKTTAAAAEALVAAIAAAHSYELPAIAIWPVTNGHRGYAEWVEENSRGPTQVS
jgi:periplasmic divalent cation tolerance protein